MEMQMGRTVRCERRHDGLYGSFCAMDRLEHGNTVSELSGMDVAGTRAASPQLAGLQEEVMEPVVAVRPGESVRREAERVPDRAEIREAIRARARDLSATWRAAWRESWMEQGPAADSCARRA
jgi:hypothetical protein